jgi:hypothetical protein
MKRNFKKIGRFFESEDLNLEADVDMAKTTPAFPPMPPTDAPMPSTPALPPPGEEFGVDSVPGELAQMTISDFVERCKSIDPLVCMGIETFIRNNAAALSGQTAGLDSGSELDFDKVMGNMDSEDELSDVEFKMDQAPVSSQIKTADEFEDVEFNVEGPQKMQSER